MKNIAKMIAMIAAVFCVALAVPGSVKAADSTDTTRHYFTCYTSATQKIEYFVEGSDVVIVTKSQGSSYDFSKHYYETCRDRYFEFYRLNADSSGVELTYPRKYKEYTLSDGVWTATTDYAASNYPEYRGYPSMINFYVDFSQMDCDILEVNLLDRGTAFNKGTGQMEYKTVDHDLKANLYSYLLNGTFTDYGKNYIFVSHSDAKTLVPGFASASKNGTLQQSSISITVDYDEEAGVVSWNDFFTVDENTVFKGVLALFEVSPGSEQFAYRTVLTGSSYKISLGGCDFNNKDKRYSRLILRPYYINTNGSIYYGGAQTVVIDADSVAATRSASSMLTQVKSSTSSGGIVPDKGSSLSGDLEDATYDSSLPDISGLRYSELSSRDCHSVFDSWSGCFRLKWNSQNNSTDFYEIRAYGTVTYTNSSSYKTGRVTKTGVFSLVDPSEKCWVNRGKHDFCMHDLLDKWTENGSITDSDGNPIFFKEIEKLYVRTWRVDGSTGAVSYGKWSIYDVDMGTGLTNLNEKSVAGGQIIDGDSDITNTGDVSGNVSSVIDPPSSDEDVSISIGDIDLGNLSNIGNFFKTLVSSLFSVIGDFPNLFARIFCFLPQEIINMIYLSIIVCIIAGLIKIFV